MCTLIINGVLIIREGARRLRWHHEIHHQPPPQRAEQWIIGDIWPDATASAQVHQRLRNSEPILVVFDHEPPQVTLPVENIPRIPRGATVHHADDNIITVSIPTLDWLRKPERDRGQAFAATAQATIAGTPRTLLPPLLTEHWNSPQPNALRFAHTTGASSTIRYIEVINHLFGTATPTSNRSPIAV